MKISKKAKGLYLIHAGVALSTGAIIYLLFRENTYLNNLLNVNQPLQCANNRIIDLLRFYIVDALWGYALVFSLATVIRPILATVCSVSWGILWEFLQLKGIVTGTFDFLDISSYLFSALIALTILFFIKKEKYQ